MNKIKNRIIILKEIYIKIVTNGSITCKIGYPFISLLKNDTKFIHSNIFQIILHMYKMTKHGILIKINCKNDKFNKHIFKNT